MTFSHVTPAGGNIFTDLGFPEAEAQSLKTRLVLMAELYRIIDERALKQSDAAKLFGVSQPRISDLMRRKIDAFSTDSLIRMLQHAGYDVEISVKQAA